MISNQYYAHTLDEQSEELWQKLVDHLENTAQLASGFAEPFGGADLARYAGLWHDLGKYSQGFQNRLRGGPKVDHATAGAQYAATTFPLPVPFGQILAYLIAGHHAGLPDSDGSSQSCLCKRLTKQVAAIENVPPEILAASLPAMGNFKQSSQLGFQVSLYIRMLYSCLVDGDFLDTEQFIQPTKSEARQGYPSINTLDKRLQNYLDGSGFLTSQPAGSINQRRCAILSQCMAAAENTPSLFSLTVPTGGGKTISSLAFALKHARLHGLRRIIYVIPYTSIIEQNAAVFREILGDNAVVEHHSNYDYKEEEVDEDDYRAKLATENWDAPLIVTTNVRFFESLFANRSSKCRRLHNIVNSVVILDEAQMLPPPYLYPCIEALRELTLNYRVSVVLCTATQPALTASPAFPKGLQAAQEIVADPAGLAQQFKRVKVSSLDDISDDQLAERLAKHEQVLCIVNTRRHSRELFEKVQEHHGAVYHLSALMCPEHRTKRLAEIKKILVQGQPCCLIATQLIEAGVDISFPVVYRAVAGLDSIAQAAGRCNRNGELSGLGDVFVFRPQKGVPPGHFRQTADIGAGVLQRFADQPLSPLAVEEYFKELFWSKGDGLDEKNILEDLNAEASDIKFPFKQIADRFQFIENEQASIIVKWGKGVGLIEDFRYTEFPHSKVRKLQRYTVQVPKKIMASLLAAGSIELLHHRYYVLCNIDIYQDDVGLCTDDPYFYEAETLIW
ncbi:MAG: CRISPR-associated helicase Cas3' [Desulfobulbaceae bacterium]|nr:CRISPR-associated helicase Cas3' [Desulfobulbaceae bacterium]